MTGVNESGFARRTVAIVGVGLMGGSLGLAAQARAGVRRVVGFSRTPETVEEGLALGAITEAAASLEEAVAEADLAFVCTPVRDVAGHVRRAYAAARLGCVVTDVGSTKSGLMQSLSWEQQATCIGGHPLCGAETAGVGNARASLYEAAVYFLTPGAHVRHDAFQMLFDFVTALGARPVTIDAAEHDRLMALVSHLPHVLANVLMAQAGVREGGRDALLSTGPSFRDLTRIAGSNRRVWADIFLENRVALLEALRAFQSGLEEVEKALEAADADGLSEQIAAAAAHRQRMLVDSSRVPEALFRLEVQVPDRPGVLKEIMTALGDEAINVEDLSLHHMSAELGGTLTVYVSGDEVVRRATDVVAGLGYPVSTAKVVE
ncbi:MAG TPA: prephenate dehydrogenase/arogenate dehydrogenase family protein [Thermoleophilia bacterium]|nr:prephenate dehydrogenase/arogenate dehydrogenase family protein [Thermoleophilia bacterium]